MSDTADVALEDQIKMTELGAIYPYENNPKNHPDEQIEKIANSIKASGSFDQPIVVDSERGGEIIKGHGRYKAAKKLGLDEVPVIWREGMTEEEVKTARIADNKTQMESGFDYDTLGDELDALETDLSVDTDDLALDTGFEETMIEDLTESEPTDPDELFDYEDEEDKSESEADDTTDTGTDTDDESDAESDPEGEDDDGKAHERDDTVCPACGYSFNPDAYE